MILWAVIGLKAASDKSLAGLEKSDVMKPVWGRGSVPRSAVLVIIWRGMIE